MDARQAVLDCAPKRWDGFPFGTDGSDDIENCRYGRHPILHFCCSLLAGVSARGVAQLGQLLLIFGVYDDIRDPHRRTALQSYVDGYYKCYDTNGAC